VDSLQRALWVTSFVAAFLLAYGIMLNFDSRRQARIRFRSPGPAASRAALALAEARPARQRLLNLLSVFGRWAMKGAEAGAASIREALIQAGFRHHHALSVYYGLRVLSALIVPLPYLAVMAIQPKITSGALLVLVFLSAAGFYLPCYLLRLKIARRQDRIDKALPEVLDLFIVCMESGLALQAAINRVADEIQEMSPDFYGELQLASAELRTGLAREAALQNLATRTGVASVRSLVSLMIQSEKMGTSIGDALRIHADFVRERRFLKAEEMAAKLSVKILFPLFIFIFPALFIVILSPAAIEISRKFFK
jgi:tight adherence protein C